MRNLRIALITSAFSILIALTIRTWGSTVSAPSPAITASMQRDIALAILREVSYGTVHGIADDLKPNHILAARLNAGETLTLTCGYVTALALALLTQVGIESRTVAFLTLETHNGANDGHTAMEIKIGGAWYFADTDLGRMYEQPAHSLRERGAWSEIGEQYADPESVDLYPRHIDNGVIGIVDGDRVYFDCENVDADRVIGYAPTWYECLTHESFMRKFYAGD